MHIDNSRTAAVVMDALAAMLVVIACGLRALAGCTGACKQPQLLVAIAQG